MRLFGLDWCRSGLICLGGAENPHSLRFGTPALILGILSHYGSAAITGSKCVLCGYDFSID